MGKQVIHIPENTTKILVTRNISGADVRYHIRYLLADQIHSDKLFYPRDMSEIEHLHEQLLVFGDEHEIGGPETVFEYVPATH